jgi:hypothetical protein
MLTEQPSQSSAFRTIWKAEHAVHLIAVAIDGCGHELLARGLVDGTPIALLP